MKERASSFFPVLMAESAWRTLWNSVFLKQALGLTAEEAEDQRLDYVAPGVSQSSRRVLCMLPDDRKASPASLLGPPGSAHESRCPPPSPRMAAFASHPRSKHSGFLQVLGPTGSHRQGGKRMRKGNTSPGTHNRSRSRFLVE